MKKLLLFAIASCCAVFLCACSTPKDEAPKQSVIVQDNGTEALIQKYLDNKPIVAFREVGILIDKEFDAAESLDFRKAKDLSDQIDELSEAVIDMKGFPTSGKELHSYYVDAARSAKNIGLLLTSVALDVADDETYSYLEEEIAYFRDAINAIVSIAPEGTVVLNASQSIEDEEGKIKNEIVEQGNQEESAETIPVEEPSASIQTYGEGSYRIGQDLPAGEYYFTGKGGYISLYSNTAKDDLLDNGFFDGHYYMTVSDGQYLQVDDATFQLASEAQHTLADTVTDPNSMYKIGVDLVAGEYALTATNRGGYYSVYSSSDPLTSELLTNDFFEVNTFGVFSDGQYVEIEDATGGLAQ